LINKFLAISLSQHRFHLVQAVDSGAHLRLINDVRRLSSGDRAPEIHRHLTLFLCDYGLNDGRGLFRDDPALP
jgi:hypothetical protein